MRDKFQRGFDVNRKPDKAVSGCPTQFLTFMAPVSNFFLWPYSRARTFSYRCHYQSPRWEKLCTVLNGAREYDSLRNL